MKRLYICPRINECKQDKNQYPCTHDKPHYHNYGCDNDNQGECPKCVELHLGDPTISSRNLCKVCKGETTHYSTSIDVSITRCKCGLFFETLVKIR